MKKALFIFSLFFIIYTNAQDVSNNKHTLELYNPNYSFFDRMKFHMTKDMGIIYSFKKYDKKYGFHCSFDTHKTRGEKWSTTPRYYAGYIDSRNYYYASFGIDKAIFNSKQYNVNWFGEVNNRLGKECFWTGPTETLSIPALKAGEFIERKSVDFGLSLGGNIILYLPYHFTIGFSIKQSFYYFSTYKTNIEIKNIYPLSHDNGNPKYNLNFNIKVGYEF